MSIARSIYVQFFRGYAPFAHQKKYIYVQFFKIGINEMVQSNQFNMMKNKIIFFIKKMQNVKENRKQH
jgi:hypothetical protein